MAALGFVLISPQEAGNVQGQKRMACVESSYSNVHGLGKSAISAMQGIRKFSSIADVSVHGATSRSLTDVYCEGPQHINAYYKRTLTKRFAFQ